MERGWNVAMRVGRELSALAHRFGRVLRLVSARHRRGLAVAALVMALAGAAQVAVPLLLGRLIDAVQRGTEQRLPTAALLTVAAAHLGLLAAAYLLRESFHVLRRYLVERACTSIERDTTVRVVAHLLKGDLTTWTHSKVGALHGRIHRSVAGLVRFLRVTLLDFVPAILTGSFALAVTWGKQPWLGALMLGVIPLALWLTRRQLRSEAGVRLGLIRSREGMDGTVVEQLGGLEYVRAADTHRREVERVARAAEERRRVELGHHLRMSLFGSAKALNESFFHLVVLGASVGLAVHGSISFGDVWTFSLLFLNVMTPLAEIHRILDEAHESGLHTNQLLALLAEPVDASFAPVTTEEPRLVPGEPAFVLEKLRAEYRTAEGDRRTALDGVTLTVRHGETLGVAGRSGCGKTTLLRVLLRLAHPVGGRAWLGGVPLENVSRAALGRLVGYVGQAPFVFAGTVAENIAYGADGADADAIERAARLACLHEEILAMPGGYAAAVAERGQNLSGGQKQRIALARVFLKDPPILILDEGTSALDAVSERRIRQAIEAARRDRTVILVAHRLSTLRTADRVVVFDDGRIVEVGSYRELVRGGGAFGELARCAGDLPVPDNAPAPVESAVSSGYRRAA
jgi:ATP-binding cassette, subfamily B, bacterial